MSYEPHPIPTDDVELPTELSHLAERLAEHVHDLWAIQRMADGWRYGPHRDDEQKLHPCLVPYGDLPPGEKKYDRLVTDGTLKAIISLGYDITKRG